MDPHCVLSVCNTDLCRVSTYTCTRASLWLSIPHGKKLLRLVTTITTLLCSLHLLFLYRTGSNKYSIVQITLSEHSRMMITTDPINDFFQWFCFYSETRPDVHSGVTYLIIHGINCVYVYYRHKLLWTHAFLETQQSWPNHRPSLMPTVCCNSSLLSRALPLVPGVALVNRPLTPGTLDGQPIPHRRVCGVPHQWTTMILLGPHPPVWTHSCQGTCWAVSPCKHSKTKQTRLFSNVRMNNNK